MFVDIFKIYKDVKVISVNHVIYLGVFKEDIHCIDLEAAIKTVTRYTPHNIDDWIMHGNLDSLENFSFLKPVTYYIQDLCLVYIEDFKTKIEALRGIKEKALRLWENQVYLEKFK